MPRNRTLPRLTGGMPTHPGVTAQGPPEQKAIEQKKHIDSSGEKSAA